MSIDPTLLQTAPLFADLDLEQLTTLLAAFQEQSIKQGEVLFQAGDTPTHMRVVVRGSVFIHDEGDEVMTIRPVEPLGELSALTGERRIYSARAAEDSVVLTISAEALREFLESNGAIAYTLHRNLLRLAARKIGRDRRRQHEMRENIISTQKAMKRMQDALLDSEDNVLHAALFEQLDALIEQNRKVHYLVEPSRLVPTELSLDGKRRHRVTALSNEWLYFTEPPATLKVGSDLDGLLYLDGKAVPVTGKVDSVSPTEARVFLDELVAEYDQLLSHHLDRARILDVVL